MKRKLRLIFAAMSGLAAANAYAVPNLQLNIIGGSYDLVTETVIKTGTMATVNAYLQTNKFNSLTDTYALSVALSPKTGPAAADLGSFKIDGNPIDVTDDMTYGVPPIETVVTQLFDPGDLAKHAIFETFFYELQFTFDGSQTTSSVNTQDNPGWNPTANAGTDLYFMQFVIDTTSLDPSLALHFDLYNLKICKNNQGQCEQAGDADISQFAPFSHDAELRPGGFVPPQPQPVPEPGILWLLATGLLGLRFTAKKFG